MKIKELPNEIKGEILYYIFDKNNWILIETMLMKLRIEKNKYITEIIKSENIFDYLNDLDAIKIIHKYYPRCFEEEDPNEGNSPITLAYGCIKNINRYKIDEYSVILYMINNGCNPDAYHYESSGAGSYYRCLAHVVNYPYLKYIEKTIGYKQSRQKYFFIIFDEDYLYFRKSKINQMLYLIDGKVKITEHVHESFDKKLESFNFNLKHHNISSIYNFYRQITGYVKLNDKLCSDKLIKISIAQFILEDNKQKKGHLILSNYTIEKKTRFTIRKFNNTTQKYPYLFDDV